MGGFPGRAGGASGRIIVLATIGVALIWASPAQGAVTCSHSNGTLRISAETDFDETILVRSGIELQVRGGKVFGRKPKQVVCSGPTSTVTNTDAVVLEEGANVDQGAVEIDLTGGPFAPGATPEAGGSEIELTVKLNGDEGYAELIGGPGVDAFQMKVSDEGTNVNLNAAEDEPDPDLELKDVEYTYVFGQSGADAISTVSTSDIPPFLDYYTGIPTIDGGSDDDVLTGGAGAEFLFGGGGNDLVRSRDGSDLVEGGGGADKLRAGPGRDYVFSGDRSSDSVGCGGDRDAALGDHKDRFSACERRRVRPGQNPFPIAILLRRG